MELQKYVPILDVLAMVQTQAELGRWVQGDWFTPVEVELVRDGIITHVPQNDSWQEGTCGTAGCFAGWTVMIAGYKPKDFSVINYESDLSVQDVAASLLDMEYYRAAELFSGSNDMMRLQMLVGEFVAESITERGSKPQPARRITQVSEGVCGLQNYPHLKSSLCVDWTPVS